MKGAQVPRPRVETAVDQRELTRVGDRVFYARVRVWTMSDPGGRVRCATVTPFAIVVKDPLGERELPLPDAESSGDLGDFLRLLVDSV